jgi:hypothetical protein
MLVHDLCLSHTHITRVTLSLLLHTINMSFVSTPNLLTFFPISLPMYIYICVSKIDGVLRVIVHGFVADLKEFYGNMKMSVAPLRWGAGVKGKINSSMK